MLFEDVKLGGRRGRLACMEVSESGVCSEMEVILERDSHLSYPRSVPVGGELFLIRRRRHRARRSLPVQRVSLPGWSSLHVLRPGPARRHCPFRLDDALVILHHDHTAIHGDTALLFLHAGRPLATSSRRVAVSRSARSCRSAGHLFWKDGRLFRPTQDCAVRYGYAITVNEITALTVTQFDEHPVAQVMPTWAPGASGHPHVE